jgi:hypothetical protein
MLRTANEFRGIGPFIERPHRLSSFGVRRLAAAVCRTSLPGRAPHI